MPELPEAETIARDLRQRVIGRTVAGVEVIHDDVLAGDLSPARLAGALRNRRLVAIGRRGKNVVIEFRPPRVLVVNLGMTGRLVASESARAAELRHVAARLELEGGGALLYDDTRRFGRLELFTAEGWAAASRRLGLEPLSEELTAEALHRLTSLSRSPIRNWLLDQRRIAGVGNIYANEALHRAGVHPGRPASTLTRRESARLRDELRAVLLAAIEARGTTFSDFRDGMGEAGGFAPLLSVYGREGRPCLRCGTAIERFTLTNRSAFCCPRCQPEKRRRPVRPRGGGRARD